MNSRRLWLAIGAVVLLAGLLGWMRFTAAPDGNLTGSSLGGSFSLVDQDGKTVTEADFAGKYRLMYFGYTFCPDICPTDVALIAKGLKAFEVAQPARAADVQPIFVTVDPERDDPKALKAFVGAFHPRLIGLGGIPAQVDAARKTFGIYARKVETGDPKNYLVDHFAVIYLFGRQGEPIAFLPHGATADEVAVMLETYVR
ncbi:electron transporter SenC [Polymorphobacter glacialis]|uniref:Electron transporter SenC n=1 Tax=Sandarakinorhabdus glacialis TaxID=1614636 RepID=A0A917E6L4_9SPHN|nr:SCO family protein [Polymorphobacter glacialis]GGE09631.1 electron transporter SenC [Polymorphobacter glacialis]